MIYSDIIILIYFKSRQNTVVVPAFYRYVT